MSANPDMGNGWEIQRGFITPQQAQLMGEQALAVIADAHQLLDIEDESLNQFLRGVTTYEALEWSEPDPQPNALGPYLHATAPDLMQMVEGIMRERTGPSDDKLILNHFEPQGLIKKHADFEHINRDVVGLIGIRGFMIRDNETKEWRQFITAPGDRIRIDNSGTRPAHLAFNPSDTEACLSVVK